MINGKEANRVDNPVFKIFNNKFLAVNTADFYLGNIVSGGEIDITQSNFFQ